MSGWRCTCNIAPSVLAADLSCLKEDANRVLDAGADSLHLDVMDGHFVPNITFCAPVIKSLRKHTSAFFDVHMMVSKPEQWVDAIKDAGGDQYTFHLESTSDVPALCAAIRKADMKVGIAVKPGTGVEAVLNYITLVDMVLVMTVEPGFGGQKFMPNMMPKVVTLRKNYPKLDIQVDGGVGPSTIDVVAQAGANRIVAGSAVFKADDPAVPIRKMRHAVERAMHDDSAPSGLLAENQT